MPKQSLEAESKKNIEASLKASRQHVADLEADTTRLTGLRDEAANALPPLRARVRSGEASVDDLVQAETKANSLHALLVQHLSEIEEEHQSILTLSEQLGEADDALRLADLMKAREAALAQREELETQFVSTLRSQLQGLMENASDIYQQAKEIVDIRKRQNPHSIVSDAVHGDTYYAYPDGAVHARFSHYSARTDGFKSLMLGGGPELLLTEVSRDLNGD